ncbi:apoptosis inducing factor family protein [Persicimonas caeni]|nr:apoptosis inducing factor family protein [Persicimonas caeni]
MPTKTVAKVDDLQDGEMKQVEVGDTDVLLTRIDGDYHAVGAHCVHYGAPLANGVLSGNTVICPWHHAVYNVTDGEHIEPPGRDCLNKFEVNIEGDEVVVTVPDGAEEHRQPDFGGAAEGDEREFLILGAGAAGSFAAETLRRAGYTGKLAMITYEDDPPYDRPNLSKAYLAGDAEPDWLPLREKSFYKAFDIDLECGRAVERVEVGDKKIIFDDGETRTYDALLLATGGTPRTLDIPGTELDQVMLLRNVADADAIIAAAEDARKAVVIGSSFIGMEVAASLTSRDIDVSVASIDRIPFERVLGERVGEYFLNMHRDNGVEFYLERGVERIEERDGSRVVVLDDGTELEADLVVMGVGVRPRTSYLSGIALNDDASVTVDATMKAADGLWAAGDIARFPHPKTGESIRIEHWRLAEQHGKIAALNMAGEHKEYDEVPFFWTRQFDTSVKYVGYAHDWDEINIEGDIGEGKFIARYLKDGRVLAACGTMGAKLTEIHDQMRRGEEVAPA